MHHGPWDHTPVCETAGMTDARWIRFSTGEGTTELGTLGDDDQIRLHHGDLFGEPTAIGATVALADVTVLAPCQPTKIVGLWNNLRAAAEKNGWSEPAEPLYFVKPSTCV